MGDDALALVRRYFDALEQGDGLGALEYYATDVVQQEFPNRLVPNGATRDLSALREAAERGRTVMTRQRYEILHIQASGDQVAVEALWTGTLAVPFGSIPTGGEMRARFAIFLKLRDGKIVSQRNYDCFEPF